MKKSFLKAVSFAIFALIATPLVSMAALPVITAQPVNQTNTVGGTVNFGVTATSDSPLFYQWTFNSSAITNATNALLTLTNIDLSQAGNYSVTLSNDDGPTNSATATLTVYLAPGVVFFDDFSGPTLNPIWQTNLPNAYSGSFPYGYSQVAQYIGAPNYDFESVGGASVLRMTNIMDSLQRCGWSSTTNFVTGDFRYEARFNTLIQSPTNSIDGFIEIWVINATNSNLYDIVSPFGGSYDGALSFFVGSTVDNNYTETPFSYANNTWYRIVLTGAPGQNIRASILDDNGNELIGQTLAHDSTAFGSGFKIALSQLIGDALSPYPVNVAVDYVKLTTGVAPTITSQPANVTATSGSTATLSVSASGSNPLYYQWTQNGLPVGGATNSTLMLSNVQTSQAGYYAVSVVNAYGAAFSSNALLNVGSGPVITNQPSSQSVASGGTVIFNVSVVGTAPINYQWKFNGANLAGATNVSLQLTNVQSVQAGNYSVFVTNLFGSVLSSNAALTVQVAPYIVTQPTNKTVTAGSSVSLVGTAGGSQPLLYLWSFNGTNLIGTTNNTLILTNVQPSQAGIYVLTVTNAYGGIWSSNALLTVNGVKPSITTQPGNQYVMSGSTATFTVSASGTAPLYYQWNFNGTNIAGATSSSLVLTNVQAIQAGNYAVVVTNAYGSITSSNGVLNILSSLATAFFDDFSGTNLNANWQASLPNGAHSGSFPYGSSQTATYLGGPNYSFNSLNSNSVIQLSNSLSTLQRRGWDSVTNYGGTNFYYDVRFNTLTLSSTSSIDGFVEIWIIDAANSNRYDIVSPFSGNYGTAPSFFSGSSIDNSYTETSVTYSNNTWYHLVLQSAPGQNIRASILNDAGTELIGRTFAHNASAYTSGFKVGLSQSVGNSGGTYPVKVAVDYVQLSAGYTPAITSQPANQTVVVGGTARFNVTATGAIPLAYQWYFGTNVLLAQTNSTLVITNVQLAQAGNYSVTVSNYVGYTNSLAALLTVAQPPVITLQPTNQTVLSYNSASFSVGATGTGSLNYQWRKNGTNLVDGGNITGSTTTTLNLASVSVADAASYDVIVSNSYAATNSAVAVLTVPQTGLIVGSTNVMSGGTVTVSVLMNALGVENSMETSVGYDPTKLVLQSIQTGQATSGAYLQPLYTYTNQGYVGFAIFLNYGSVVPAGTQEVAQLTFYALPVTNTTAVNVSFGDYPDGRQLLDNNLESLPATYQTGTVTLAPAEYAADVYPRFNGDHQVNLQDWGEIGRMVAGLDVPTNSDELLRADCAPRNAPDGVLTIADWVQAGRYAVNLDPLTLVTPNVPPQMAAKAHPLGSPVPSRILQVGNVSAVRGQNVSVPVLLVCNTSENAAGFTVNFNTNLLKYVNTTLGTNVAGGRLNVNSGTPGKLGVALALSPGQSLPAGTNQIVVLQFTANASGTGTIPLTLDNSVVQLEIVDNTANVLAANYVSGTVVLPAQPSLAVTSTGSGLQLTWPLTNGTFQVQAADNVLGPWTTLVLPLTTNGGNAVVSVLFTNQQQYFRLTGQ